MSHDTLVQGYVHVRGFGAGFSAACLRYCSLPRKSLRVLFLYLRSEGDWLCACTQLPEVCVYACACVCLTGGYGQVESVGALVLASVPRACA